MFPLPSIPLITKLRPTVLQPTKSPAAHTKLSSPSCHQNTKASPHHSHPQISPLAESPTANPLQSPFINQYSLQYSQPKYLRELFLIQPTRSTRSSSYLTLSRPPVTSRLKFSNRAISHTAPRLWNDLPSELRKLSVSSPSSSTIHPSPPLITHHQLPQSPLSISPHAFHSKLKSYLFKNSYPDSSDPPPSISRPKRHPP